MPRAVPTAPDIAGTGGALGARPRAAAGARLAGTLVAAPALVAGVIVVAALGLALGARSVAPGTVVEALVAFDPADADHVVVREMRLPRTLLGLAVGAALGMAGALMQGLTRNPIADPGLLGVNAGASLAVVIAITWLGAGGPAAYAGAALAGTTAGALLVYAIGIRGRDGEVPVRLALVGAGVTAAATSLISVVLLTDLEALERYRLWMVGSVAGGHGVPLADLAPLLVGGAVLAVLLGRALDALALGDEVARSLGGRPGLVRAGAGAAVVMLCGGATALAGPIVFVGLVVPHIARRIARAGERRLLLMSAPLGAMLLVAADVTGRLIARPSEIEAGLVVAFIGAPVMIALVRRARWARA